MTYETSRRIVAQQRLLEISRSFDRITEGKVSASGNVRHKCFLSYFNEDAVEVLTFVEDFSDVFIPKCIGVSDDYPWIDSDDDEYVMDKIRDDFLADSTVTLVLIGKCTWARKFVDWEIYSSLRKDRNNRLNGLLGIQLPSVAALNPTPRIPARLSKNVIRNEEKKDIGYGRYIAYPKTKAILRSYVEDAFNARKDREKLRVVGGPRLANNSFCS